MNKRDIEMVRRVPKTNLAWMGGRGHDSGTKNMTKKTNKKRESQKTRTVLGVSPAMGLGLGVEPGGQDDAIWEASREASDGDRITDKRRNSGGRPAAATEELWGLTLEKETWPIQGLPTAEEMGLPGHRRRS